MLEGWPLFIAGLALTSITVLVGRRHSVAWALLGAAFMLLRLPEFAVAAWVAAVILLVYRISNPPAPAPDDGKAGEPCDTDKEQGR